MRNADFPRECVAYLIKNYRKPGDKK